ncbi:MAG: response regulator [Candidatus Omnitrophota bacterium]|nr:response regulator [Candidatus Omnitrophota bacterium]
MSKKILIVDDEQDIKTVLEDWLTQNQYEVFTASNGAEAYETIIREIPDLVIMDVLMPEMTGYQVFEKLKGQGDHVLNIPIIIMSGRPKMKDFFTDWKKYAFIPKPFSLDDILLKVREFLGEIDAEKLPVSAGPEAATKPAEACSSENQRYHVVFFGWSDDHRDKMKSSRIAHQFIPLFTLDEKEAFGQAIRTHPACVLAQCDPASEGWAAALNLRNRLMGMPTVQPIPFYVLCEEKNLERAAQDLALSQILSYKNEEELFEKSAVFLERFL